MLSLKKRRVHKRTSHPRVHKEHHLHDKNKKQKTNGHLQLPSTHEKRKSEIEQKLKAHTENIRNTVAAHDRTRDLRCARLT